MDTPALSNDKYRATLRSTFVDGVDTTLNVTAIPANLPTIITVGWETDYETVFRAEGVSGTNSSNYALTGITKIKGYTGNIPENSAVNCLNNEEYFNQWGDQVAAVQASVESILKPQQGVVLNGRIVPSVTSNNLTVALKGLNGDDPSATNPVYCRIENTVHTITSALSVTINAGANWFSAGSAELATKEIDYFVYLCWNTKADPDTISIMVSRIPYATLNSDFSETLTGDHHRVYNVEANATDSVVNIGRFAATLSAGAGYTWSVPTFTNANLIQRPIYETRLLSWLPALSGTGSMTATLTNVDTALYKITGNVLYSELAYSATTGGVASTGIINTLPMSRIRATNGMVFGIGDIGDGGAAIMVKYGALQTSSQGVLYKYNTAAYALTNVTVYGVIGQYTV